MRASSTKRSRIHEPAAALSPPSRSERRGARCASREHVPPHGIRAPLQSTESVVRRGRMPIASIDYGWILGCIVCAAFFVKGARLEGRSPLAWGGASVAAWLFATWVLGGGLLSGLAAQLVLFAGLTWLEARRRATRATPRD